MFVVVVGVPGETLVADQLLLFLRRGLSSVGFSVANVVGNSCLILTSKPLFCRFLRCKCSWKFLAESYGQDGPTAESTK